ncbi:MAG TPA: chemotaxis protein CheW [Methanoregula sp.]|nr:chemotaxis protein CheW [Methanoregula sp.]
MAQLLLFSVGSIRGALPLEETMRVIRMVRPKKRKAGGPPWDAGTINLHGRTLTVVSMRNLFGLKDTGFGLADMLIIARAGNRDLALWVDATSGVHDIPLPRDAKGMPHQTFPEGSGVSKTAEGLLVIYDLPGLIASGGIIPDTADDYPVPARDIMLHETGRKALAGTDNEDAHINAVLAERAAKIARPEEPLAETKTAEVLKFRLSYREYAIEMGNIREVILTGEITPVPGTPDFISGICVVRGEISSLLDLRVLLAIPETGLTDLNRVIVLTNRTLTFGILADQITGIGTIDLDHISSENSLLPVTANRYVKGVSEGPLVVLDTRALFSDPAMIIDEA